MMKKLISAISAMALMACSQGQTQEQPELAKATFAGGCFWCMEAPFEKLDGVHSVISGYTGGDEKDPTYNDVSRGTTGHLESVQITFDPAKITYKKLLEVYWMQFDPTDAGGSFFDRGHQYTSAVFYHDGEQKVLAEESREALEKSGRFDKPIVTSIRKASTFYPAEAYHQDYYKKNTKHYKRYRTGSGRDRFIKKYWGEQTSTNGKYSKPADDILHEKLTPLQYRVTQEDGTERPFQNVYWNNKKTGIYVDVVSGEPLFSSTHKYKSGTGWPSFWRPLEPGNIMEKVDGKLFMKRTEVRSKHGDSHLGHLFDDGPKPTGLRYCINSASLRFVPKEDLEEEGFGEYLKLFE